MTNQPTEHDLAEALRAQAAAHLSPGDLTAVARRGRQRRTRSRGIGASALSLAVLSGGAFAVRGIGGGDTLVIEAAEGDQGSLENGSGDPSDSDLAVAAPLPDLQDVADYVIAADLCEQQDYTHFSLNQIELFTMPDGAVIMDVVCALGPYQPTDERLFLMEGSPEPGAEFAARAVEADWLLDTDDDGIGDIVAPQTLHYGLVDVLEDTGELRIYARFRGTGDCGIELNEQWNGERFVLQTSRAVFACTDEAGAAGDAGGTGDAADWPLVYPVDDTIDSAEAAPADISVLLVDDHCDSIARQAQSVNSDEVLGCIEDGIRARYPDIKQIWVEDVIDDGDSTLVVWRASAFDGDLGLGTPWGFETIHVTDTTDWSDREVQRLEWEDPSEADWMYAYRIEFVDAATLRLMVGWHQGECYWMEQMDLDGGPIELPANPFPRPATLDELNLDPSLCQFDIEFEPEILDEMFRSSEPIAYS